MQNQCYRKAPRMISDESGKRFKETRGERLDIPVEFDENIASLLAKIEQKRKEKMMRLEAKMQEAARANADALETAKNSIISRNKRLNIDKSDSGSDKSAENSKPPAVSKDSDSEKGLSPITEVIDTQATNAKNTRLNIDNSGSDKSAENTKPPAVSKGSDSEKCLAPSTEVNDTEITHARNKGLNIDHSGSGKSTKNSLTPELASGSNSDKCNINGAKHTNPDLLTEVTSTGEQAIMKCPQDAPISESQPDVTRSSGIRENSSKHIIPGPESQTNRTDHDSSLDGEQNEVYSSPGDINTVDSLNSENVANKGMVTSANSDENNNKSRPITTSGNDRNENVETVKTIDSCETKSKDKSNIFCIKSNNARDSSHEENTSSEPTNQTSSHCKDVTIEKIERSDATEETEHPAKNISIETEIRTKIAKAIFNEFNGVEESKDRKKADVSSNTIEVPVIKRESSKQHEATNSFLQEFAGVIKDCSKSIAAKTEESLKVPSRSTYQNSDVSTVLETETADSNETLCDTAITKSVIKSSLNTSQSHRLDNSGETHQTREYERRSQVPETTLPNSSNGEITEVRKDSGNIRLPEVPTTTENSMEGDVGLEADVVPTVIDEAGYSWVEDLRIPLAELDLPDQVNDPEFENRLKVFNNYRQFGLMYSSKGNNKVKNYMFNIIQECSQKSTKISKYVFEFSRICI